MEEKSDAHELLYIETEPAVCCCSSAHLQADRAVEETLSFFSATKCYYVIRLVHSDLWFGPVEVLQLVWRVKSGLCRLLWVSFVFDIIVLPHLTNNHISVHVLISNLHFSFDLRSFVL